MLGNQEEKQVYVVELHMQENQEMLLDIYVGHKEETDLCYDVLKNK